MNNWFKGNVICTVLIQKLLKWYLIYHCVFCMCTEKKMLIKIIACMIIVKLCSFLKEDVWFPSVYLLKEFCLFKIWLVILELMQWYHLFAILKNISALWNKLLHSINNAVIFTHKQGLLNAVDKQIVLSASMFCYSHIPSTFFPL